MIRWLTLLAVILVLFPLSIAADSNYRLKFSTEASDVSVQTLDKDDADSNTQGLLNFRYLWSNSSDNWAFDLQLVSELNYAPGQERNPWLHSVLQFESQNRAFWTLTESSNHSLIASIDRAQLTYKSDSFRASIGRFPNSWGRGLVFQPLDVFNAFAPTLVDREFKRGNDSLLIEYAFNSGSELQVLTTVRKRLIEIRQPSTTYALKYFIPLGNAELETVGAVHYGDEIFGVSMAIPISESVVRTDVVHTCLHQADCHISVVINVDYTFSLLQSPIYIFGEYFYNGIGVSDLSPGYSSLSKAHTRRLGRGDLFSLGRNLLAFGAHVSLHPLWNQTVTVLTNANDKSALFQTFVSFTPTDHANLNFGFRLPFGDTNEEFGELTVDDDLAVGGVAGVFAEFIYYR